ncbi:hypothetical protein [Variovorax sp.]|uniref:hypothetical protein n=1 Tax=Variovorax sp. TaxID=1871043 RepID=UPI002D6A9E09|nr:hypothetical protein [Variovorax sp.]HYP85101.1 hypothetical protein [Variovorax sp.]
MNLGQPRSVSPPAPAWILGAHWSLAASFEAAPPDARWRQALAARLAERPRRLGVWAELGLHGARACLDAAGLSGLPEGALVRVASRSGPQSATHETAAHAARSPDGMPLPFGFIQSQPSLLLATLCRWLDWQGDGACVCSRALPVTWRLAQSEALAADAPALLLGSVEESGDELATRWWLLLRTRRE